MPLTPEQYKESMRLFRNVTAEITDELLDAIIMDLLNRYKNEFLNNPPTEENFIEYTGEIVAVTAALVTLLTEEQVRQQKANPPNTRFNPF